METLIEELNLILEDDSIPRNVGNKIKSAIIILNNKEVESCIRANQALSELSELSDDPNIPTYIRPQLWNIISQLETI